MKTIFRIMALFMLLVGVSACDDDENEAVPTLEVNAANLNGYWQLTEWNGQPLAEGTYCYINFIRKDKSYKMYQKFDSMYARCISGTFEIEVDDYMNSTIKGLYNYGMGYWNNSYIVTDLFSNSMIWTVKDNLADVTKYERCDVIPQSIIDEAKEDRE